jgi:large subunit ribosomal protein L13
VAQQKTFITKPEHITHDWWVVDAKGQTLGRLASRIATIIRGKHKPYFTPNLDCGDYVIVINCEQIAVTGQKMEDKRYYRHSGYPGGIKSIRLKDQLDRYPDRVIKSAVKGMLPKSALGHQMIKKLKVYAGPEHPHATQNPKVLDFRKV